MLESSDRVAWNQYRDGGAGTGNGLLSFNDRQPDRRRSCVTNFFADTNKYANIDGLVGQKGKKK